MLDDPWWTSPEGRETAAVICARHGAPTLPQVLYQLSAEGDPLPELTVLREVLAAGRTEQQLAAELASCVRCPYCGAEPGRLCVRRRGRFAGQPLGSFAERLASPFRSVSHHRVRYSAVLEAGLVALDDASGLLTRVRARIHQ